MGFIFSLNNFGINDRGKYKTILLITIKLHHQQVEMMVLFLHLIG
jgi:hypothetical protein